MPEGDTVHKIARYLRERIEGKRISSGSVRDRADIRLSGRRIEHVRAHGKHLFLELDDGTALRSHLGMHGSWHRYPVGRPWQRPESAASIVLEVDGQVYVCFRAQEVEHLRSGGLREREIEARLGPDLAVPGVDLRGIAARARAFCGSDSLVVDILLDQRVASGIGNVYKSELLFLDRVHPRAALGGLEDGVIESLYRRGGELIALNVRQGPRVTRFPSRARAAEPQDPRDPDNGGGTLGSDLWVYGRRRLPCLRCGTSILYARLGERRRSTYWCPHCQELGSSSPSSNMASTRPTSSS